LDIVVCVVRSSMVFLIVQCNCKKC